MKISLLILLLTLFSFGDNLSLKDTRVEMNWEQFQELSNQKTDTVMVQPKSNPPVPIILENCDVQVLLNDSTGTGKMIVSYVVLSESSWVEKKLFSQNNLRFSSVSTSGSDFVQSTDTGYVLFAKGGKAGTHRKLTLKWSDRSTFMQGLQNFLYNLPKVSTGSVRVVTPRNFSNISCRGSVLLSKKTIGSQIISDFSLPRGEQGTIKFAPPVKVVAEKNINDNSADTLKAIKKTQITSWQEGVHFLSEDRDFIVTRLQLTVNHAPISTFKVVIPTGVELLRIEGNGVQNWKLLNNDTLQVNLTFELSGDYSLMLISETPVDSVQNIMVFNVVGASREKGVVAVALEGAGEAKFTSISSGGVLPLNLFNSKIKNTLRNQCSKLKKNFDDILLAAEFNSPQFNSTVKTRRHKPAFVTNAVADSGKIITAITKDYKTLTGATYYIKQKNRQFVALKLPVASELWSVSVNGENITPYIDKKGGVKIPLQRFGFDESRPVSLTIKFTFFQKLDKDNLTIELGAPVPDIPVSRLSWSLFYPDDWVVRKSSGDFSTFEGVGLKKERYFLSKSEQSTQFASLQKSSSQRKRAIPQGDIPMMGLSANHLVGKRILIVNESPIWKVTFMQKKYYTLIYSILIVLGIGLIGFGILRFRKR